ncbi:MAG TPA: PP2C family protein-serine/threonine phosphatase [Acidimicrobiales bacterium]|nr:PP2C family protein-serine/threonine phosphatase [Acidimicrobiales bacterium]
MRPPGRWVRPQEDVWTAVAVAAVVVVFALDLALAGEGFEGTLLVGPVVASATVRPRRTAQVLSLALLSGIVAGAVHDRLTTLSQALRLAGVLVGGGFCVLAAHWRERREHDLQRVTRVAEVAQLAILRPIPSRVGPVAFASRYLSAAEQAFIGGDLYEVVPSANGVRVVVGDVRGKGLEAVHLAALVLGSFREAATVEHALEDVAAAVDRAVSTDIALEDFVTAVFIEFRRGGEITVVNCGHHPPLRVSGFGAQYLAGEQASTPLGLTPSFTVQSHRLSRGDRVLLYTDGLVEARSADRCFFELAPDTVEILKRRSLDAALEGLVASVLRHAGGRLDDDLALLLAEVRG